MGACFCCVKHYTRFVLLHVSFTLIELLAWLSVMFSSRYIHYAYRQLVCGLAGCTGTSESAGSINFEPPTTCWMAIINFVAVLYYIEYYVTTCVLTYSCVEGGGSV